MKSLKIRKASVSDVKEIFRLGSQTEEFFVNDKTGGFWSKKKLLNWVKNKEDLCLVATIKNLIIGFILSTYHQPTKKVTIENVFIAKHLRNKGIGRKIITEFLKTTTKTYLRIGAVYVMSLTRKKNHVFINLMEKLGFTVGYKDWVWIEQEYTDDFPKKDK